MKINNETKIGLMVMIVLVMLAVVTFKTGEITFKAKGYKIRVQFKDIDGVEKNAPVTLNGLEVGRVDDIQILYGDTTRVQLTLWLSAPAKLRKGAKAFVKNMGFMGEKYVALTTGDDNEDYLPAGSLLEGQEPADFQKILAQGEVIAKNLKEISEEINQRLKVNSAAIDDVIANIQTTSQNLTSISGNVNERLTVNETLIDQTVFNLKETSKNLEELSFDLKENPWKLMYKPRSSNLAK